MNTTNDDPQGRPERDVSLRPCPCGQTPERLVVTADHTNPKWARVGGSCCGMWEIEYRNNFAHVAEATGKALAESAWNDAPRANP